MSKESKEEIEAKTAEKPIEKVEKPEIVEEVKEPVVVEEVKPVVVEEVKEPEIVCPKCPNCGGDTAPIPITEDYNEFICKTCLKRIR